MTAISPRDSAYGASSPLDPDTAFTKHLQSYLISNGIAPYIAMQLDSAKILRSARELEAENPPAPATPSSSSKPPIEEGTSAITAAHPNVEGEPFDDTASATSDFETEVDEDVAELIRISQRFSHPTGDPRLAVLWTFTPSPSAACNRLPGAHVEFMAKFGEYIALRLGSACVALYRLDRPSIADAISRFAVDLLGQTMFRTAVSYFASWVPENGDQSLHVKHILADCVTLLRECRRTQAARDLEMLAWRSSLKLGS